MSSFCGCWKRILFQQIKIGAAVERMEATTNSTILYPLLANIQFNYTGEMNMFVTHSQNGEKSQLISDTS